MRKITKSSGIMEKFNVNSQSFSSIWKSVYWFFGNIIEARRKRQKISICSDISQKIPPSGKQIYPQREINSVKKIEKKDNDFWPRLDESPAARSNRPYMAVAINHHSTKYLQNEQLSNCPWQRIPITSCIRFARTCVDLDKLALPA